MNALELLPGYLAGELTTDEQAHVEAALRDMPEVRAELERYRALQAILGMVALLEQDAPTDLSTRVARQVALQYFVGLASRYLGGLVSAYGRALVYYLRLG